MFIIVDEPEVQGSINVDVIKAYKAAKAMGCQPSNQFKLVTLGPEGAGKTSTVNSLLSLPFQPKPRIYCRCSSQFLHYRKAVIFKVDTS